MILQQGVVLTVAGMAAGTVLTLVLNRVLAAFLFGVTPGDLPTLSGAVAILSVIALLACYIPARPAARLDPAAALRRD